MEKEYDCVVLLIVIAFSLIGLVFIIDYINLRNFKKCYENNFQYEKCKRYLDY